MSGVGEDGKRDQEHEFFGQICEVEIGAVSRFIDLHGLPWDDGVYINEDPPGEQEGKVEHADAFIPLVFPEMRKHGESGDHGHQMQKQNDVAQEGVGHVLTLQDFKVIPHSLVSKPEEHAHAHEDPEKPDVESRAARTRGIGQEGCGGNEQETAPDEVAGNGKGIASGHEQRRSRLGEHQRDQQRDPEFGECGQGKLLRAPF